MPPRNHARALLALDTDTNATTFLGVPIDRSCDGTRRSERFFIIVAHQTLRTFKSASRVAEHISEFHGTFASEAVPFTSRGFGQKEYQA